MTERSEETQKRVLPPPPPGGSAAGSPAGPRGGSATASAGSSAGGSRPADSTQQVPVQGPSGGQRPPASSPFQQPFTGTDANPSAGPVAAGSSGETGTSGQTGPSSETGSGLGSRMRDRLNTAAADYKANREAAKDSAIATAPAPKRDVVGDDAPVKPGRRNARRARLRLTRIDPWSVMKTAFLLAIAFGVVTVVSVLVIWSVLGAAGLWDSINATIGNVLGSDSTFDVTQYVGTSRVIGFTLLVAVIDVVLLTAVATLAAFIYNMAAALLGGVEVTLAEEGQ